MHNGQLVWQEPISFNLTIWLSKPGFSPYIYPQHYELNRAHTYHYVTLCEVGVSYMPQGTLFTQLMAIIDFTNAAMPFDVTAY